MKKIILLALTALMMAGCDDKPSVNVDGVNVVTIDSCEYISCPTYCGFQVYSHKGNCRFCAERRKQEVEELVKQIKKEK